MFKADFVRVALHEGHVPVLKVTDKSLSKLKDVALILSDNRDLEKISANIFDISEQLGLNIDIFNYLKEHQKNKEQVVEHYYNLATIFSKSIKVIKEEENPIRILRQRENFLHIVPFTKKLTTNRFYSLLSTDPCYC